MSEFSLLNFYPCTFPLLTVALTTLDPSPDWIVGVSGLELCLSNCSWVDHVQLNLYPFDAGTDSGLTYIVSTASPRCRYDTDDGEVDDDDDGGKEDGDDCDEVDDDDDFT